MRKIISILLLFVIGITLLPWQTICLAHPLGHDHHEHEHDKPSACEIHKQYANAEGQHILPPMECNHIAAAISDYQQTENLYNPSIQLISVAAVVFELIKIDYPTQHFSEPPFPKCRSASIISENPHRGPPLA